MGRRKIEATSKYRKVNFMARERRGLPSFSLDVHLLAGLRQIARDERKSVSWLVETALAEYFGVTVMLRRLRGTPKPAYRTRDNVLYRKRAS